MNTAVEIIKARAAEYREPELKAKLLETVARHEARVRRATDNEKEPMR